MNGRNSVLNQQQGWRSPAFLGNCNRCHVLPAKVADFGSVLPTKPKWRSQHFKRFFSRMSMDGHPSPKNGNSMFLFSFRSGDHKPWDGWPDPFLKRISIFGPLKVVKMHQFNIDLISINWYTHFKKTLNSIGYRLKVSWWLVGNIRIYTCSFKYLPFLR